MPMPAVSEVDDALLNGPFGSHTHDLSGSPKKENGSSIQDVICPAPSRRDMEIQPPVAIHK